MKSISQRIRIPEPCTENWNNMLPEEKGRHCEKCAKTVVDFTGMTDVAVLKYLMQNQNACGRFNNHQLNRELTVHPPLSQLSKFGRRMTLAGLFAMQLWPRKGEAQAVQADTSGIGNTIEVQPVAPVFINYSSLRGKVIQPDSLPLRALKLQFRIDTFFIEVDVDSSGVFNFQYPAGMKRDSAEVKILSSDSVFILKILNMPDNSILGFNVFQQAGELMLVFDKTWACYFTSPAFTFPQFPQISWGIPRMEPWIRDFKMEPFILDTPYITSIQIMGDTIGNWGVDTAHQSDSLKQGFEKNKHLIRKRGWMSSFTWGAILLSVVAALIFWVRREKKVKQIQDQSKTVVENDRDS